ncbi:hypothetical protein ACLESD_27450 [Pyxidicoccus sp. 3LFB2]
MDARKARAFYPGSLPGDTQPRTETARYRGPGLHLEVGSRDCASPWARRALTSTAMRRSASGLTRCC